VLIGSVIKNPVDSVCGRSLFAKQENVFNPVFSKQFLHQKGTLKELQVKGNLCDCSQILTVASFTQKQQKGVSEFFISNYFIFKRAIFV